MKKYLVMLVALFIMGACQTSPQDTAGSNVNTAVDPSSQTAKAFIEKFNAKEFRQQSGEDVFEGDILTFNSEGVFSISSDSQTQKLHGFNGDKFTLKVLASDMTDNQDVYLGVTIKGNELNLQDFIKPVTSASDQTLENIDWNKTLSIMAKSSK